MFACTSNKEFLKIFCLRGLRVAKKLLFLILFFGYTKFYNFLAENVFSPVALEQKVETIYLSHYNHVKTADENF
jgi:hypothetical protein